MSAYSTVNITRSKALAEWAKQFGGPTEEELEILINKILKPRLYNASIVPDDWENEDYLLD